MPRKVTYEEFLNKFYKQNKHAQDIEILGTYVNTQTKIKCRCKKCGHIWQIKPNNLLRGNGCPKCAGNVRLTHEEFINRLQQVNSNIEILGTYINGKTNIKCRCKKCEHEWTNQPRNLLQGSGCPKCAGNIKLTHKEFMEKFYKQNPHAQDIEVVGTYINSQTKILCRCKIDGYEWEVIPYSLLRGYGCPKCGGSLQLTHEEFINRIHQVNTDIEILGTYIDAKTKIKCKCKKCNYEWKSLPGNLLQGHGCPKCVGREKTQEEFVNRLQQVNPDIEVLGTYEGAFNKIKCKCKICEHEWEAMPTNLLRGSGCSKCKITKGEKRITQYLDNLGINYIYNTGYFKDLVGTGGGLLRPDFIIPSLNIWIEYDGEQHFKPTNFNGAMSEQQIQDTFKKVQQNDQIKNQYAKDNNWILVRIPYTEYDNIEQILAAYIAQEQVI